MKLTNNRENLIRWNSSFNLIFQCLLLAVLQHGVYSKHCPAPCKCMLDVNFENNLSTCKLGDTVVTISWRERFINQVLNITCTGSNITCFDLPQFDISNDRFYLEVYGCPTSLIGCINGIFSQPSAIIKGEISNLTGVYKEDDFKGLNKLQTLYLQLTDADKELPALAINSLQSMSKLTVTGGDLQLRSNVFNQSKLLFLQLESNNITSLPTDAFNGLSKLRTLRIKYNYIYTVSDTAFRGLCALNSLYINALKLISIDVKTLLPLTKLNTLTLENTELNKLQNDFVDVLKLKALLITNNHVEMSLDVQALARLPYCTRRIELVHCNINALPPSLFVGSKYLRRIVMDNNMIEILPPNIFSDLPSLKDISFKNNSIKALPKKIFASLRKVEWFDFSYNSIENLTGDIFGNHPEMTFIFLDHNRITNMDLNVFNGFQLRKLDLSANKLERIIEVDTLSWQTDKLNLSDNKLKVFEDWFVNITDLVELDLSYNEIEAIQENHIYSFKSKAVIDLRYNNITQIVRDTSEQKLLTPMENITLYLANNSLECDCQIITIINDWQKHGILGDFDEIICVNGDKISNKDVFLICNETYAFIGRLGMIIIGTFISIILLISLFTQRRKIWQYILIIFNRDTIKITELERKQDSLKEYDLFVSFAYQDGVFVTDQLLPKIENDFGQKVCVHYRDWIVGDLIPDQIIKSVESSRITIIILTEHFIASEWSYLEFRTAHNLSIQEGKPRVVIIVLDENILKNNKLSDDLKSYIAVNTYLLWGDTNFWDKLQKVLPRQGKVCQKSNKKILS